MSTAEITLYVTTAELDEIVAAYWETALWSSTDPDTDEPMDSEHDAEDVADEAASQSREEIVSILALIGEDAFRAYVAHFPSIGPGMFGHDLWLTRNHHGAGFWDRGLGQLGEEMSDYAQSLGTVDLYVGDDGLIYGM